MKQSIDINPIPYLTWSWLKINGDSVSYDFNLQKNDGLELSVPDGVSVSGGKSVETKLPEPQSAIGEEAAKLIADAAGDARVYTIARAESGDSTKTLVIRINADAGAATHQIIHALGGSRCKIILLHEGGSGATGTLAGTVTKIYAEDDSQVQIAKIQLCGDGVNLIDETSVVCGERAKVSLVQIPLGGSHINVAFHATLAGSQSEFKSDTAYIVRDNQQIDMNQVVVHKGKKTSCNMRTDGTVLGNATKTYRGTINLERGCSGSTGTEMESTLLLSADAVVKSAPIILCGEDDIKAEHGSTLGKLSGDMLFYMQSRGISRESAEAMMSRAKISAAAAQIPDEDARAQVQDYLDGIFGVEIGG